VRRRIMANTFIFDDDDQPDMGGSLDQGDDQPDDSESGNRSPFTMVAIGIGVIILVSLICMVLVVALWLPGQNNAKATQQANNATAQAQAALSAQETEQAAQATPTLPPTPVLTDTPSSTPVVVFATDTPASQFTQDPATATVEALQTQLAMAQLTATFQPSPSGGTLTATPQIPETGFADEFGLPGLFIVAMILLGVILLARRLREVPAR
jgi:type II secretory pathway pseudopilin PulG